MQPEEINLLVQHLQQGDVILYPTDTVWAIGCDAHNQQAVERIVQITQNLDNKGLITLVDGVPCLQQYVQYIPEKALNLIEYHVRPLTIVYPNARVLPAAVLAPDGSAAIRVCKDVFCKEIIKLLGRAILSVSANIAGKPHPQSFSDIDQRIVEAVDVVAVHRQKEQKESALSPIVRIADNGDLIFISRD